VAFFIIIGTSKLFSSLWIIKYKILTATTADQPMLKAIGNVVTQAKIGPTTGTNSVNPANKASVNAYLISKATSPI